MDFVTRRFLNCVYAYFTVFYGISVYAADSTDITRLRDDILRNYDPQLRPVQNDTEMIDAKIHFLRNAMEFDEIRGVMTLHLLTVLTWEDQHVKWDPLNYGNLSEIQFFPTELWKPDISLINNYDTSETDHFGNTLIVAYSTSELWWVPPTKFQVQCPTDFRMWPYDKQTCGFQISSWSYHGDELNLTISENRTELITEDEWQEHLTENREWEWVGSRLERKAETIYCCPKVDFIDIRITVEIKRRSSSHTAAVTVVGLCITAAILISFWLNPFSHERLPLTLVVMLVNSIYLQFMYQAIPNNGSTVPLAICFFRDSLIMVTFGFAWTVVIRYIAKTKRNSPVPLPQFIQNFLSGFTATILCLNPRPQTKIQSQRKCAESSGDAGDVSELVEEDEGDIIQQDWEWLARLLDRIAFIGYLITYIIFISAFL